MIMSKHLTDDELISLAEGDQSEGLSRHLSECEVCRKKRDEFQQLLSIIDQSREATPPQSLQWEVLSAIQEEKKHLEKGSSSWLKVAAVVTLLMVSFLIGKWSMNDSTEKMAAIENEVEQLRTIALQQMVSNQSASQRITAVNQVEKSATDRGLVMTLFKILNTDDSPNVRYAAVQALGSMIEDDAVKNQLVKSLEIQTDPLIQIALINMLTEANEKSAIPRVKDIIENESTSPEVKRQAEIALQILI